MPVATLPPLEGETQRVAETGETIRFHYNTAKTAAPMQFPIELKWFLPLKLPARLSRCSAKRQPWGMTW
jgi:hypothetical protein